MAKVGRGAGGPVTSGEGEEVEEEEDWMWLLGDDRQLDMARARSRNVAGESKKGSDERKVCTPRRDEADPCYADIDTIRMHYGSTLKTKRGFSFLEIPKL